MEIVAGEAPIGDGDRDKLIDGRCVRRPSRRLRQSRVEPLQRAPGDPQRQFVEILDKIVDGAERDADFSGKLPRLEAREPPAFDGPLRRLDKSEPLLVPPLADLSHILTIRFRFMNGVHFYLERRSWICDNIIVNNVHITEDTMFKTLFTLVRGGAAAAGEEIVDRNALLILDQQLRDATAALDRSKKALALAMAQDQQEGVRLESVKAQIADLETRVGEALTAGDDMLARHGAEAIATLEADRDAAMTARALFASEISRLRAHVAQAERRITAVDRGRRIARAAESVRRLRAGRTEASAPYEATLAEAETTLSRLRQRQTEACAAEDALDAIDASIAPSKAAEDLAAAGFGPKLRTTAEDVLARLKTRTAPAA